MTGAKPDERLRTPMQWTTAQGAGFTRGRAWQRMADDSLAVSVAAQERDTASLLALYRRLIRLHDRMPALAGGTIVRLETSSPAVAAFLRTNGSATALVVANLGDAPLDGVQLAGQGGLATGAWRGRTLLGGASAAPLRVGMGGTISGYVPLARLDANTGYLFELVRWGR